MIRSFGMSLTSRQSWSANQTGPSQPRKSFAEFHQSRVRQHIGPETRVEDLELVHLFEAAGVAGHGDV